MQIPQGPIGHIDKSSKEITIIGAGISGLLMGYYLKKSGFQVSIYEKESNPGGKINTIDTQYGPAETAANAIFTNDDVIELMNELSLNYSAAPHSLKKYVWRNGKGKTPPFTIFELIRIFFGAFKKIDRTNLSKKTVYEFFSPMMGKFFAGEVMSAALGGIYAAPTTTIHFQSLFKHPFKSKRYIGFFKELMHKRKTRSKFKAQSISFEGGMKTFVEALRSHLKENLFLGHEYSNVSGNTIICTDAINASNILQVTTPKIAHLLAKIKYNSMFTSTVFTNKPISFLKDGFGVVFPPCENFKNLGILHNTAIFPKRVKDKSLYSYTFMTKAESDIENIIHSEIDKITNIGFSKNIVLIKTTQWKTAIPIYDQNRFNSIMQLRSEMNNIDSGLVLFGNYIDGISIREMVTMAKNFAQNCNS